MPYLTRDEILGADDLTFEEVEVPEWGGTVRIRSLTGSERDAFEASLVRQKGNTGSADLRDASAKLVAKCIVDDDGKRLFTDADVRALGAKSGQALNRVFSAAVRLAGLSPDEVEELAGNSDADQSDGSISA